MPVKPIFIFSLPRAGSTMLQRLLGQHQSIDTDAEPWLALPVFFALKDEGVNSVYGHSVLSNAITGYVDALPGGRDSYYKSAARFLNDLYDCGSTENSRYFIDKTPRYHLIVDDILRAFPDAKVIFLWRNPLSIASSMIKTWGDGKWNLYMFNIDLYRGINSLVNAFGNNKNCISVRYEDLVHAPEGEMERIMAYLELEYDPGIVHGFKDAKKLDSKGRGDPTGQHKYSGVSEKPMNAWKEVMANPFRKTWCKQYLDFIGKEKLAVMGYDLNELQHEIREIPTSYQYLLSDFMRKFYGGIYNRFCIEDIRRNKPWRDNIFFSKN